MSSGFAKHTFGFEWAHELEESILAHLGEISCMELIPENFFEGRFESFLKALAQRGTPVAIHGVSLSIGAAEPLNEAHLEKVLRVAEQVNTVNLSEHLALTSVGEIDLDALTPLAFTEETADHVCRKVEKIQKRIRVPFLLENVSWRFIVPDTEYTEPQFINRILDRTGCGLLLDATNVYTNAKNFGFDPYEYVDELNLNAVQLVHLAGGEYDRDGFLMDSHDSAVEEGSWQVYRYIVERAPAFMTIVERTGKFPKFGLLSEELARAKAIVEKSALRATPPTSPQPILAHASL